MKVDAREVIQPWPDVQPEVAAQFMEVWFQQRLGADGIVALTPIQAKSGFPAKTQFASVLTMSRALRDTTMLADLTAGHGAGGAPGREANLYHAAALLSRKPAGLDKHPYARGKKSDVGWVPGLWLDLDVSGEKFTNEGDIRDVVRFMWMTGVQASALVATGSGGLHPYFRVEGGLDPQTAETMSSRLRAWVVAELSRGAAVDQVSNCDRILRTPGSVRFPKAGEPDCVRPTLARLDWFDERKVLDMGRFLAVTAPAWDAERAARERAERERADVMVVEKAALREASRRGGFWGRMQAMQAIEQLFIWMTWDEILLPHGWELVDGDGAPDGEGRRTWTRPGLAAGVGVNRRSMLTDWHENPDVATLKSDSPETGLRGLAERRIPLSKFRVWLELSEFKGDVAAFVRSLDSGAMLDMLHSRVTSAGAGFVR